MSSRANSNFSSLGKELRACSHTGCNKEKYFRQFL